MSIRKEYNKAEQLQFIDTLIKTEQVEVFINNVIDDMENKEIAVDTLKYLYNKLIYSQNNLKETALYLKTCILILMKVAKQDYYWLNDWEIEEAKDKIINFEVMGDNSIKFHINKGDSNE